MTTHTPTTTTLDCTDHFIDRHIGPRQTDIDAMLQTLGLDSLEALVEAAVPASIRFEGLLDLPPALSELDALRKIRELGEKNVQWRSFIGMGYSGCVTPAVIQRDILENPGWYTQYTPYQAEISQGRLEALLNFQTLISDLTGLEIANASMLDEGTAAAEAMTMLKAVNRKSKSKSFFVDENAHPQTIAVLKTRAAPVGIELLIGDASTFDPSTHPVFGALLQTPDTTGRLVDVKAFIEKAHTNHTLVVVAADLMALTLMTPPGELGADICVGNAQRFGVPMGFGGPHAAFFATLDNYKRQMPGRLVGVSKDVDGDVGYRLTLQTREQHIRREKATSNICTAQVLLAIVAGAYAVYHGPKGIAAIAKRIHLYAEVLALGLKRLGVEVAGDDFFDTVVVNAGEAQADILNRAAAKNINLRAYDDGRIGIALDQTVVRQDLVDLFDVFSNDDKSANALVPDALAKECSGDLSSMWKRQSAILEHPVFNSFHSETELLRYLKRLENKDLSLTTSMTPLGSCTMKLNATSEMLPITWPSFRSLHPFAPLDQAEGYQALFSSLQDMLAEITGLPAVTLMPNAGSQGEYTGMQVIRAFHHKRGQGERNICLIPSSAHGTNPASATMAGMKVVVVGCDDHGNISMEELKAKAQEHAANLAALMVTYPSTHGVFEAQIREVCQVVHDAGGQVYLDGANMNAQVGLCRPGDYGADVIHVNLHKTFCIPHGGGGPGVGPIAVASHLARFLPGHPLCEKVGGDDAIGPVSAAPWGSAGVLPISWMYIAMLGPQGARRVTQMAILNANYMAKRLEPHFPVLYTGAPQKEGARGLVAHEFILNCNAFEDSVGITVEDIAKRLMDYGFHAPTMSWPVHGTLMVEPTESESRAELDRFCEALISIRKEIAQIESGALPRDDNPLKNAPHKARALTEDWTHPYAREQAVYPAPWTRHNKFWPPVGRIDNVFGDRNVVCACPPVSDYADSDDAD